jgi:uncharacterized protein YyaL (SSP411 family)
VPGFSEDYAAVAEGLLAMCKLTGKRRWLDAARTLLDRQLALFWDMDHGGFFSVPVTTELWVRGKQAMDGATLAANGISLHVLLQLGDLTGQQSYRHHAWQTAAWAAAQLQDTAAAMPYSLMLWDELMELNPERIEAGNIEPER